MSTVATGELEAIVRREHANPHSILGAHPHDGGVVIRTLRPTSSSGRASASSSITSEPSTRR